MKNQFEVKHKSIRDGILQSEIFKKIPKKLQESILEKIKLIPIELFLSDEGGDILFQDDLEYYVYEEHINNNKNIIINESILFKEKKELRESIFKTSILDTKQSKEKILLESFKIDNGIIEFYSYKYVDIEHLNVCFVEDDNND